VEYEEFKTKLKSDDTFFRLVIRTFYKYQDLEAVERLYELPEGTFDRIFAEDSDFETRFSAAVEEEFKRLQRVYSWPRINAALTTLASVMGSLDDETKAVSAATALVRAQQALLEFTSARESVEEDDIDRIWKELENEAKQRKDDKDSEKPREGIRKRPDSVD